MKNLFSKWLLAFTVFAAVGFISCGSDDDDVTPPEEEQEVEANDYSMPSQLISGHRTTSFSYNPDGTVSEIKEDDGFLVLCYRYDYSKLESDHIITVRQYEIQNGEESESNVWGEYTLEDGRVVASRNLDIENQIKREVTYAYNEKGQLISYKSSANNEYRITWENDVITDVETKYGDEEEWHSWIQSIEYSKVKVGRYGGYFDLVMKYAVLDDEEAGLLLNGMFGAKVKYFPKKMLGGNTLPDGSLEFSSKTSAIPSSITFMGVTQQIVWMKAIKAKVKVK